jgi:hypothetical protein
MTSAINQNTQDGLPKGFSSPTEYSPAVIPTPDYSYGLHQNTIDARTQVRNSRPKKYCTLKSDGASLASYDTNDSGMAYGSQTIKITKQGRYLCLLSCYFTAPSGQIMQMDLRVNGSVEFSTIINSPTATISYAILPGSKVVSLNPGDSVTFTYS